ncbi:MAG: response regulator [Cyanothece sp. SIO1E1]|nr:response regulator [Cyanothece sp. SIO1E1]
MRILIVEDDEFTAKVLETVLAAQNYAVEIAPDGQAAWDLIDTFAYDLILLDVMLPKLDGISLCQQLRSQGYEMPVLLLTGKDTGHDKAIGLDAGADDYVVKPFDQEELIARIRALLRRGSSGSAPVLIWGDLQLDPSSCEVAYDGKLLSLTPKEYALLELLLRNHRRVFSCGIILEHLWSYEDTPGEEAVRTHVKGLRQKLKSAGAPSDLIETVYGIGYRLKPLAENPTSVQSTAKHITHNNSGQQQMLAAIAGVWARFKTRINEQVNLLEQAATALVHKTLDVTLQHQAEREAHTLAGALGTFGLHQGSRLAREIEHLLASKSLASKSLKPGQVAHLSQLIAALRQEINQADQASATTSAADQDERPGLLIIDGDQSLAEALVAEANLQGLQAEIALNLSAARESMEQRLPQVVLLDPTAARSLEAGLALMTDLQQRMPPIPVVVLTAQADLKDRIRVARLGGRAFLHKPMPPAQVLEAVSRALQPGMPATAKVMVVDDDLQMLAVLKSLLEPWGLQVTTLSQPQNFWATLESTAPDLLILDIKMPQVSGIELCQVVRNDPRWSGLPIIFLTAYTDADRVNQVFAAGADDFVAKPIVGPELLTRIINRLERMQLLRKLAETDPLTQVPNRHKSTQTLEELLHLAERYNQPLSFAVLDLDHFKQINDNYGHDTGDAVLRQVGHLLMRSFRHEDVIGRWGGEEFIVGLYGISRSAAIQRLTKVLATLRQQVFTTPDQTQLQITFSAGVAQYPEDGTDLQALYRSADSAMYQAKAAGRDRVLSAAASEQPHLATMTPASYGAE